MKKGILSIVGMIVFIVSLNFATIVNAEGPITISGSDTLTTTTNVATLIPNVQLNGMSTSTTPVKLLVTNGSLQFGSETGLTFNGSHTGSAVYISGTVADINAALTTLRYTRSGIGSDTLEISLVNKGEVFFTETGHLYEYISQTLNWNNAKTAAEGLTRYGAAGYLVTILSSQENDFVAERLLNAGWMGASDSASEGAWRWVTGPESGTQFWSGLSGGNSVGGKYANWGSGEPNDSSSNEDCAQFLSGAGGKWNDLPCSSTTLPGYVAEFGSTGNMPTVEAKNISITTVSAPVLTTSTPLDNSTSVAVPTELVFSFSSNVTTDTGEIRVYKSTGNTLIETIDISQMLVQGSGTQTLTIPLTAILEESTAYYVHIDSTVFKDNLDNYFPGFSNSTTLNFTTGDFTPPVISNVTATTSSTTAQVSWNTNELSSSRVSYSVDTAFGIQSSLQDTSPRVSSHTVNLTGLVSCTEYNYKVISADPSSNTTTSTSTTFKTSGCISTTEPTLITSNVFTSATTSSSTLTTDSSSISVSTPPNVTSTSSTFVIQIKALPQESVLPTIGLPQTSKQQIGNNVFDVKAIINSTTILNSFNTPVTITYRYTDEEIIGIDESTLKLFHYSEESNSWSELDNCSVDQGANVISCFTTHFSIFTLFGDMYSSSERPAGTGVVGRAQNLAKNGNVTKAYQLTEEWERLFKDNPTLLLEILQKKVIELQQLLKSQKEQLIDGNSTTSSQSQYAFTKDLEKGMEDQEVKLLQEYLNNNGFEISTAGEGSKGNETIYFGALTQEAVIKFQEAHSIFPAKGYFGSITRNYIASE